MPLISPDMARLLYEHSPIAVRDIAVLIGVGERTLYKRARAGGWRRHFRCHKRGPAGRYLNALIDFDRQRAPEPAMPEDPALPPEEPSARRRRLVALLWQSVEKQMHEVAHRVSRGAVLGDPALAERDSRSLALLARSLERLIAIDRAFADEDELDTIPRDIDELRRELARRVEAIIARRADGAPGEPVARPTDRGQH
jgi:hypothetical protein